MSDTATESWAQYQYRIAYEQSKKELRKEIRQEVLIEIEKEMTQRREAAEKAAREAVEAAEKAAREAVEAAEKAAVAAEKAAREAGGAGRLAGARETLLETLREIGSPSAELVAAVEACEDEAKLRAAVRRAARLDSIDRFTF